MLANEEKHAEAEHQDDGGGGKPDAREAIDFELLLLPQGGFSDGEPRGRRAAACSQVRMLVAEIRTCPPSMSTDESPTRCVSIDGRSAGGTGRMSSVVLDAIR